MFLGIDLGTSEVKALLMDADGHIVASKRCAVPISRPRSRWSEQAPDDWWQAMLTAVEGLKAQHRTEFVTIQGIGLSGHMHGATLLDSTDKPLRPAILWNDTRADIQCAELTRRVPQLSQISGNLAMPGFTAPKLLWVAQHEPDIFRRTATVLLPKDYLRLRLTGEKVSDLSDASGTLWLDVGQRTWSDTLLAATGLSTAQMPALVEGGAVSGMLRDDIVQRWGLRAAVPVAGGAGDNAASAVGLGAVLAGDGFVSLGTSGVIFVVGDQYRANPNSTVHAFCHALPARWHQMSVMLSAASCLRWAVQLTGARDEASLVAEVAAADTDDLRTHAPIFLPYLSGERTPHNDAYAQGVFFGLTHRTDRAALGYAVLEGVAFGLADGWSALQAPGQPVKSLSFVGGGSRSAYWGQLIADVLRTTLHRSVGAEAGAALGAARLAQISCGADERDVCCKLAPTDIFSPRSELPELLATRLRRYRSLYSVSQHLFDRGIIQEPFPSQESQNARIL